MDILAALKQEEAKFEKQVSTAQQQLDTVRAAMKLFGGMNGNKTTARRRKKKSAMSAATKAKIAKAAKERWAKYRAAKAKGKN